MRQIDHAIAAHKAGKTKEAEALYRDVLKHDGRDFDALHMLGVICAQRHRDFLQERRRQLVEQETSHESI